jgi:hypothetical protein
MLTFLQQAALHASACAPHVLRVIVRLMQSDFSFFRTMLTFIILAFLQTYSGLLTFHAFACAPRVLRVIIRLMQSDEDSHHIPPYLDNLVGSDQIIRLGQRTFPYSSTPAQ